MFPILKYLCVNVTLSKTTGGLWRELNLESFVWRVKMEDFVMVMATMLGSILQFIVTAFHLIYTIGGVILIPFVCIVGLWLAWKIIFGVIIITLQMIFEVFVWLFLKVINLIKLIIMTPKQVCLLMKNLFFSLLEIRKKDLESADIFIKQTID
jgi:hypothetical protein